MSQFRRKLLESYATNKLVYPGLIAAWSAKGKTNDDADRNVLKDLTGNGHDITLNNFAWNTESGYSNPKYPDALVFDGVDDYGVNESIKYVLDGCEEYTIIAKRKYIDLSKNKAPVFSITSIGSETNTLFLFEHYNGNNITFNKGISTINVSFPDEISWQTNETYNQQPIKQGTSTSVKGFVIGRYGRDVQFVTVALYSYYIFNRTLSDQEIKSFIRKYIDPEYLLPSETVPTPPPTR